MQKYITISTVTKPWLRLAGGIITILLISLLAFCHRSDHTDAITNGQVITAKVETPVTPLYYNATIAPIRSRAVFTPIDARVNKILFHYGDTIKKGVPILVLSSTQLIDDYRKAVSDYLQAKDTYQDALTSFEGSKVLFKAEIISREEFESERSSLQAKALSYNQSIYELVKLLNKAGIPKEQILKLSLQDMNQVTQILNKQFGEVTIKSPVDGVALIPIDQGNKDGSNGSDTSNNQLQMGSEVKADQLLISIGDLSGFSVKFQVSEININQIRVNQPATVTGDAFPGIILQGKVTSVSSQAQPSSGGGGDGGGGLGMFDVEVQIPIITTQQRQIIHIGMSAKVELQIKGQPQIMLPIQAILTKNGQNFVTKIDAEGHQQDVPIIVGETTLNEISIVSGVQSGDRILLQPPTNPQTAPGSQSSNDGNS